MKKFRFFTAIGLILLMASPVYATVSSETTRVKYTGNGITTVYAYPFKIFEDDDLLAVKALTSTGAETTLILNTDYTVSGAGVTGGGNLILTAGSVVPSGYTLTILRNIELTQETDYVDGQAFSAESLESAIDKTALIQQQQAEQIGRAPKLPKTSSITDIALPNPAASNYIGWNAGATQLENKSGPVITTATQYEVDALISYGGGVNYTQATIQSALTAIGTVNKVTLLLRPGSWAVITPLAIPSNVTLSMPRGSYFTYSGTGVITGGGNLSAYNFGAVGNGTIDDATALNNSFAWVMSASNQQLTIPPGEYRANSQLNLYSAGSYYNNSIMAYGAQITSYVTGRAMVVGKDGLEITIQDGGAPDGSSFEMKSISGLKIKAGNANVTTLLKLGGYQVFDSKFNDITLQGWTAAATEQGLLIYGVAAYFNQFNNLSVRDCERLISINRDWVSGVDLTYTGVHGGRSNANRINGATFYGHTLAGIYLKYTGGNRFTGLDFTNANGAAEDINFNTDAVDNYISGRHESSATNTHNFAAGVTGNYVEVQLTTYGITGAQSDLNNQIIHRVSGVTGAWEGNAVKTRFIYSKTDSALSIRHPAFNGGNDAMTFDSNGPYFSAGVRIGTGTPASAAAAGVVGQVFWDASYIYICTATNTWKRVAIATW